MNFYASREFLDAAAAVYFPGRAATIENVKIGDEVLRLLLVDGRPVTRLQFLDYHQPLTPAEVEGPVRPGRYARAVVRGVIEAAAWRPQDYPGCGLAPFLDWSGFADYEAYYRWVLSRHRGFLRERERRWRQFAAAFSDIVYTADDRGGDVMAAARCWKSRQLIRSGHDNWIERPQTRAFLAELDRRGLLTASTLRAGGRPVAVWIGFRHRSVWSGWIFAFDPAFAKYSPGHRLLFAMLEDGKARGDREFDFSEGAGDYKLIYASHGRLLGDIGRPPLARAAVVTAKRALQHAGLLTAAQAVKRRLGVRLPEHA